MDTMNGIQIFSGQFANCNKTSVCYTAVHRRWSGRSSVNYWRTRYVFIVIFHLNRDITLQLWFFHCNQRRLQLLQQLVNEDPSKDSTLACIILQWPPAQLQSCCSGKNSVPTFLIVLVPPCNTNIHTNYVMLKIQLERTASSQQVWRTTLDFHAVHNALSSALDSKLFLHIFAHSHARNVTSNRRNTLNRTPWFLTTNQSGHRVRKRRPDWCRCMTQTPDMYSDRHF